MAGSSIQQLEDQWIYILCTIITIMRTKLMWAWWSYECQVLIEVTAGLLSFLVIAVIVESKQEISPYLWHFLSLPTLFSWWWPVAVQGILLFGICSAWQAFQTADQPTSYSIFLCVTAGIYPTSFILAWEKGALGHIWSMKTTQLLNVGDGLPK